MTLTCGAVSKAVYICRPADHKGVDADRGVGGENLLRQRPGEMPVGLRRPVTPRMTEIDL